MPGYQAPRATVTAAARVPLLLIRQLQDASTTSALAPPLERHLTPPLAEQVTAMVHVLRTEDLYKAPGVSETIDWVAALVALDADTLDADAIDDTLGVVLKAKEDLETVRGRRAVELLDRAMARTNASSPR